MKRSIRKYIGHIDSMSHTLWMDQRIRTCSKHGYNREKLNRIKNLCHILDASSDTLAKFVRYTND